jgi:hypothetical protein
VDKDSALARRKAAATRRESHQIGRNKRKINIQYARGPCTNVKMADATGVKKSG